MDKAVAYRIKLGGVEVSNATYANVSRLVFEERFFETSHVELTVKDGLHFDLTPEQLKLGTKFDLEIGYVNDLVKVFEGQIVEVAPSGDGSGVDTLQITAFDYSHLLKVENPGRIFTNNNCHDIAVEIIENTDGKREDGMTLKYSIDPDAEMKQLKISDDLSVTQESETDWEVLVNIAHKVNHKILCRFDTIYIMSLAKFQEQQPAEHKYTFERNRFGSYGNGVYPLEKFEPRVSAVDQRTNVEVISFDPVKTGTAAPHERRAGTQLDNRMSGYTDIKVRSDVTETLRVRGTAHNENEARTMAQSELRRRAEQLVKGDARVMGNPYIRAGQKQTIVYSCFKDIGRQFSGEYTIKGVRHQIETDGLLTTEFDVMRERLTEI